MSAVHFLKGRQPQSSIAEACSPKPRVISARPFAVQFNPAHAAIVGVIFARDEPFLDEPIHGHAN